VSVINIEESKHANRERIKKRRVVFGIRLSKTVTNFNYVLSNILSDDS
jgi:hypothetical protein